MSEFINTNESLSRLVPTRRNRKNKLPTFVLALFLVLSVSGCGPGGEIDDPASPTATASPSPTATASGGGDRLANIDVSVCEAYFPDEVLTGTVPSDLQKGVIRGLPHAAQAPDRQGNPGATGIFCFWDVVGGSHPDEPFFDWQLKYTFSIYVRGPESEQDFRWRWELLAEDSRCSNVELDQETVACVGTGGTGPTVISAFDPNLFLTVEAASPDLPEDTVRSAANSLMLHAIHEFGL